MSETNRQGTPGTGSAAPGRLTRAAVIRGSAAAMATMAALPLASCGVGGAGGAGSATPPQKPAAPVELEYWYTLAETHPTSQARVAAMKVAEAANRDYFTFKYAENAGAAMTKVTAASAAGTPPNILVHRPFSAAQLMIKGALVNYDQHLKGVPAWQKAKDQIPQAFHDGIQWLGTMAAIPFQIAQQAMMYAPEKLENAGVRPPAATWTWNDFEEISKRVARPPDVWGMSVGWRTSGWQLFAGSNGVRWTGKDQLKVSVTQPESLAAVEFMTKYTFGDRMMPLGAVQGGAGELLGKGQTVFEPQGPYRIPVLRTAGITRFGAVTWPRGPQRPTTYNWGTLYSTFVFKNTDAAKERASIQAAVALLSDEAQAAHAVVDLGLPVTKSGTSQPAYQRMLTEEPVMKQFAEMFPYCDVAQAIPSAEDLTRLMDVAMADLYAQKVGAREALETAERELQRIHDEYLRQSKK